MANANKLRRVVVRAGLAGLTTTRVLRQYHDVTIYERASVGNATGGQDICFFPGTECRMHVRCIPLRVDIYSMISSM